MDEDIQNVMYTIELPQNPFIYYEKKKQLINLASGQVVPSEIKDDIKYFQSVCSLMTDLKTS